MRAERSNKGISQSTEEAPKIAGEWPTNSFERPQKKTEAIFAPDIYRMIEAGPL